MKAKHWYGLGVLLVTLPPVTAQTEQGVRLAQPYWWPYTLTTVANPLPDLDQWSKPLRQDAGTPNLGFFSESGMLNYCVAEMTVVSGIERRDLAFATPFRLFSYNNDAYSVKGQYYDRKVPEKKYPFTCYYHKKGDVLYFLANRAGIKRP